MPLDTTRQDLTQLETTRGFQAAYQQTGTGEFTLVAGENADQSRAEALHALWCAATRTGDADFLMVRASDFTGFATLRAGLIILGDKTLNAGILRHVLKALPTAKIPAATPDIACALWTREQKAVWAIAERLGRVEAPRTLEFIVGEFEYVLEAESARFAIVDDEGGLDLLRDKIALAVQNDLAIEYTLGAAKERSSRSTHDVADLFGTANDQTWSFEKGWPVSVPAGASFSDISAATSVAISLAAFSDDTTRADLLDASGRKVFSITAESGASSLTWNK